MNANTTTNELLDAVRTYQERLDDLQHDATRAGYTYADLDKLRDDWKETREELNRRAGKDERLATLADALNGYEDTVGGFLDWIEDGNVPTEDYSPNADLDPASEDCAIAYSELDEILNALEDGPTLEDARDEMSDAQRARLHKAKAHLFVKDSELKDADALALRLGLLYLSATDGAPDFVNGETLFDVGQGILLELDDPDAEHVISGNGWTVFIF